MLDRPWVNRKYVLNMVNNDRSWRSLLPERQPFVGAGSCLRAINPYPVYRFHHNRALTVIYDKVMPISFGGEKPADLLLDLPGYLDIFTVTLIFNIN